MATLTVLPLLQLLRDHADDPDLLELLDPDDHERSWLELPVLRRSRSDRLEGLTTDDAQLWLISWPPGARTGWHDHGTATGAFTVLRGRLVEHSWADGGVVVRGLGAGDSHAFAGGHIHDVRNDDEPALSLHAYSPRLATMTRYAVTGGRLEIAGVEQTGVDW
jgi:quercetin dioxygenase-like cupin family protein